MRLEAVNLKVLHSCSPVVTISGLKNTQTSSSLIDVVNVEDSNRVVQAIWSNSASSGEGTLLVNLTKFFSVEAAVLSQNKTEDSYKTTFLFHFTIVNPANVQNDNQPKMEASIARQDSAQVFSPHDISAFSVQYLRQKVTNSSLTIETGAQEYHRPVTVKQLDFMVKNIRQSTPYPCDANKIIIELRTNVKLLMLCTPVITISGLKGSYSTNNEAMPVSQFNNSGSISGTGAWTQTPGKLVLPLDQNALNGDMHSFSFMLYNPSTNPAEVVVTIEANIKSFFPTVPKTMTNFLPNVPSTFTMVKSEANAPQDIYKSAVDPYSDTKEASPLKIRNLVYELKAIRQVCYLSFLVFGFQFICATHYFTNVQYIVYTQFLTFIFVSRVYTEHAALGMHKFHHGLVNQQRSFHSEFGMLTQVHHLWTQQCKPYQRNDRSQSACRVLRRK